VKQWENHEQSKQHRAAVLKLKEEMMADEELVKAGQLAIETSLCSSLPRVNVRSSLEL